LELKHYELVKNPEFPLGYLNFPLGEGGWGIEYNKQKSQSPYPLLQEGLTQYLNLMQNYNLTNLHFSGLEVKVLKYNILF
jgi:hypothetical protein